MPGAAAVIAVPLLAGLLSGGEAEAQQQAKITRIGYPGTSTGLPYQTEAFRQGLRDLGHVEGRTFVLEYRNADERPRRRSA